MKRFKHYTVYFTVSITVTLFLFVLGYYIGNHFRPDDGQTSLSSQSERTSTSTTASPSSVSGEDFK